jgi:hypothetical protein
MYFIDDPRGKLKDKKYIESIEEGITILIEAGLDPRIKEEDGYTAFDFLEGIEEFKNSDIYWKLHDAQY